MGTNSIKVQQNTTEPSHLSFFWLNTQSSSILKVSENSITSHPIFSLKINKSCSIAYTKENNIIIAGGLKPSTKPTKKAYYINTQAKTVNRIPSLAKPSFCSDLQIENDKIFLIESSLESHHQYFSAGCWSVIQPSPMSLINSAPVVSDSSIFFLSGTKRNLKPTKKIFKLYLGSQKDYVRLDNFTPFKLLKPTAVKGTNFVVVGGGKDVNGDFNFHVFVGSLNFDKWKVIEAPKFPLYERPFFVQNHVIWVEFPKIFILSGTVWSIWSINEEALKGSNTFNTLNKDSKKKFMIKKTDPKDVPIESRSLLAADQLNIEEVKQEDFMKIESRDQSKEKLIPNTPNSDFSSISGSRKSS